MMDRPTAITSAVPMEKCSSSFLLKVIRCAFLSFVGA